GAPRGEPSADLPPSAFVAFLQNHEQIGNRAFGERLRALVNDDALRAASAHALLAPQIPLLFMGEEGGTTQPFQVFTDHRGALAAAVR
ncbi:malto-oligosyltrehalose trehalohydrolase, partial [Burkholderia pseudomallei]